MPNEGGKRIKGVPAHHEDFKKRRNLVLTDQVWKDLESLAVVFKELGIIQAASRSELVEVLIRKILEQNDLNSWQAQAGFSLKLYSRKKQQ